MTSMSSRGKKGPNHVHSLDKETRDRYFPEYNGGKGSVPRTSSKISRKLFEDNYDKINWSKK